MDDGRARVRALEQQLTGVGNVYRHSWRKGDLLIWDNRSLNHKREAFDPMSRRVMHRCQIKGDTPR